MIAFRDETAQALGLELIVHVNEDGVARGINPIASGSALHTQVMKTEALKQALDKYGFDAAFGGARRDEEKSRAKERIFSFRTAEPWLGPAQPAAGTVEPLQHPHPAGRDPCASSRCRTGPSSTSGSTSWPRSIPVVPLYFAKPRPVVRARRRLLIMVDDDRLPLEPGETPEMRMVRFRTLGCYPLTGAIESDADTLDDIVAEMRPARTSERQGRLIDTDEAASMEKKKREGYF